MKRLKTGWTSAAVAAAGFLMTIAPRAEADWPFSTSAFQNFSSPAIADIDGDGHLEVLFASWDGYLYCTDAAGDLLWRTPLQVVPQPAQIASSPMLVDLDGDSTTLEIVICSGLATLGGLLHVIDSAGESLVRYSLAGQTNFSPLVIDSDSDGVKEIYFGGLFGPMLFYRLDVQNTPGGMSLIPQWQAAFPSGFGGAAAAADVDSDGMLEIVFAEGGIPNTDEGGLGVHCYEADGTPIWSFFTTRFNNNDSPTIVDLDNDGAYEVLQASTDGSIYCLDASNGKLRWEFATAGQSIMHTQAVADLDGDGLLEVVVGSVGPNGNFLYCLDAFGQLVWSLPVTQGQPSFSSPSIGDLDADGDLEIVFGTETFGTAGSVYAVDHHGEIVWISQQVGTVYSSPALADLDGDGTLEICFGVYGGGYTCLDKDGRLFQLGALQPVTDPTPWPGFHRDAQNIRWYRTNNAPRVTLTSTPKKMTLVLRDDDGLSDLDVAGSFSFQLNGNEIGATILDLVLMGDPLTTLAVHGDGKSAVVEILLDLTAFNLSASVCDRQGDCGSDTD